MTQTTLDESMKPFEAVEAPENATRTSDFEISEAARDAYAAWVVEALEGADDLVIALEIQRRIATDRGERTELMEFIREQGYDPADLAP